MDASWAENNFAGPVASISIDFSRFSLIFIDFVGILSQKVLRPVAACGGLWRPVAACGPRVRPLKKELLDLSGGPPDLDDPMLRSSRLGDDGTDDADDADDADDEGIDDRTSHTLELRGARRICKFR